MVQGFFRVDLGIILDWFRVYVFFPVSGLLSDLCVVGLGLVGWIEGWFKMYVGLIYCDLLQMFLEPKAPHECKLNPCASVLRCHVKN